MCVPTKRKNRNSTRDVTNEEIQRKEKLNYEKDEEHNVFVNGLISRLIVPSGHGLFMTGPYMAISIKGSIKAEPREKNERLDGKV